MGVYLEDEEDLVEIHFLVVQEMMKVMVVVVLLWIYCVLVVVVVVWHQLEAVAPGEVVVGQGEGLE